MSNRARVGSRLNRTGCAVFILVVIAVASVCVGSALFLGSRGMQFQVEGFAMGPALHDGSFVLANRQAYVLQPPRRGDIIVYSRPQSPERFAVSRIVGLPRERVQIRRGRVVINAATLREPYLVSLAEYEGEWILKDGEYFVLGDNRNASSDSHSWGPLPASNIKGKAEWIYWPPQFWGGIPAVDYAS